MAESLIPIIRNVRLRRTKFIAGNNPKRTSCPAPQDQFDDSYISFDLLCWNPNSFDLEVPGNLLQYDDPNDLTTGFVKGFYQYRLIPLFANGTLTRLVDASLQDVEGSQDVYTAPNYYTYKQGISPGWKARNAGDRYCEMIRFETLSQAAKYYILEITADPQRLFQQFPSGNNVAHKLILVSRTNLRVSDLSVDLPPFDLPSFQTALGLQTHEFNPAALELVTNGNTQEIRAGKQVVIGFNGALVAARRALDAIVANNFKRVLRLGNPDAFGRYPFYAFSGTGSVNPRIRGERCDNIVNAEVKQVDGRWKVFSDNKELFDFGLSQANAHLAAAIILTHPYRYFCSAGAPASSLRYVK